MKSYYIYFIRNGMTAEINEGQYIGHTDVPLSEAGEKQLLQMKESYEYPEPEVVFTSPLKRCVRTAQLLYPDTDCIPMRDLVEYDFGEFEGKTAEELEEHPVFARWLAGEPGVQPPFGESNNEFANRIATAFIKIVDGLIETGVTHSAIVTHGGVIMALMTLFGLPEAPMHEWMTPGGCGYTARITPSLWSRGRKMEIIAEVPEIEGENDLNPIDDFNVEDYIND